MFLICLYTGLIFSRQCGGTNIQRSLINLVADKTKLAKLKPGWDPHMIIMYRGKHFNIYNISRSTDQAQLVTNATYRVMYVRHPFTRLVSAYFDKIVTHRGEYANLRKHIIHSYRPGFEKDYGDVTPKFPEFVDYVIDTQLNAQDIGWVDIPVSNGSGICIGIDIQRRPC